MCGQCQCLCCVVTGLKDCHPCWSAYLCHFFVSEYMIICLGFWIVFVLSRISLYQVYIGFCTIQFYCNIKLAGLENTVRSRIQSSFCKVSLNQDSTVLISIILHTSHYPTSRLREKTPKNVKNNSLRCFFLAHPHSLASRSPLPNRQSV